MSLRIKGGGKLDIEYVCSCFSLRSCPPPRFHGYSHGLFRFILVQGHCQEVVHFRYVLYGPLTSGDTDCTPESSEILVWTSRRA
jgi:hypothetical protein